MNLPDFSRSSPPYAVGSQRWCCACASYFSSESVRCASFGGEGCERRRGRGAAWGGAGVRERSGAEAIDMESWRVGVGVRVLAREGGVGVWERVGESSMRERLTLFERVGPGVCDRAGAGVWERVDDIGPGVCERAIPGEDVNMDAERMCVELKRASPDGEL